MPKSASKAILWANVQTLMTERYGGENLSRFARETGVGPGTATRIKVQETAVGLDVIEKIAAVFGVEPWQLLTADLGAGLYTINNQRVTAVRHGSALPAPPPPHPPSVGGLNYERRLSSDRGGRGRRKGGDGSH